MHSLKRLATEFNRTAEDFLKFLLNPRDAFISSDLNELVIASTEEPKHFSMLVVKYYSVDNILLSKDNIMNISNLCEAVIATGDEAAQQTMKYVLDMTTIRMINHMIGFDYQIISIGYDCLPRSLPTKWGLKKSRKMGEATMPFDLAVHLLPTQVEIMTNGFADYIDPKEIFFDTSVNFVRTRDMRKNWNHERGTKWVDNNFEDLKKLYERRISAFVKGINAANALIIFHTEDPYKRDLVETLVDAICIMRAGDSNFKLLVIHNRPYGTVEYSQFDENINDAKVRIIILPHPFQDYTWYLPQHFSTRAGHHWERNLVSSIADFIGRKSVFNADQTRVNL